VSTGKIRIYEPPEGFNLFKFQTGKPGFNPDLPRSSFLLHAHTYLFSRLKDNRYRACARAQFLYVLGQHKTDKPRKIFLSHKKNRLKKHKKMLFSEKCYIAFYVCYRYINFKCAKCAIIQKI